MALLPKLRYKFNGIRIPTVLFEFWQNDLKVQCLWTAKETKKEMISGVTKWDLCELTHLVKLKY